MKFASIYFLLAHFVINSAGSTGNKCNFGENCFWSVHDGFQLRSFDLVYQEICKERSKCENLRNVSGDVPVLDRATKGTLYSERIQKSLAYQQKCVAISVSTQNVSGKITLSVVSDNGKFVQATANITGATNLEYVNLQYKEPNYEYRLELEVTTADDTSILIIRDINWTSSCNSVIESSCTGLEKFACDEIECVSWSVVCDLKRDCNNGKDEQICDNLPPSAICTFENGTCGWRSVNNDFNWILGQGPTPTSGTGPAVDHTKGTEEGHYIYVDGRHGKYDEYARLQSLVMPAVDEIFQSKCKLRFFYHMIGRDIWELTVGFGAACSNDGVSSKQIWSKHGRQGDKWHFAEITLPAISSRYFVHFDGYGAMIGHGDIAIDDISFSPECFGIANDGTRFLPPTNDEQPISEQEFKNNTDFYCNRPASAATSNISNPSDAPEGLHEKTEGSSVTEATAVLTANQHQEKMNAVYIIAITVAGVGVAVVMGTALLCLALRRRKDNPSHSARLEMVSTISDDHCNTIPVQSSSIDMQLRCAVTELNPNYDFITAKFPEQQLREIPRSKLNLIRLLGQGAFGEVYEGRLKNLCANVSELPVAVKTLPALSTEQAETDFYMEAVIISKFMHKNVVKCLGVCFDEHPRYIILELLEGGDLRTFLRDCRTSGEHKCTLTMEELIKLSIDIANGCRHLEEKHFVHRDIAARNCLLTTRGPGRVAKIADFGMSRDIYSSDYYRKGGKAMLPIKWMPPEAFLDGVFTSKTDTWSYGVLLWEILTLGYMPYPGQTNSDVMHFVASGGRLDPPEKCPTRISKIMIMCWNSVPDIRPSFAEIGELLDMCLQDEEVLNTDVSLCHYPITESFKDAATLAKASSLVDKSDGTTTESENDGASGIAAEFKGHFESQSREPLLLSSPDS